jgi:hypothetical protein
MVTKMLVPKIAATRLKLNAPTSPQLRPPITRRAQERVLKDFIHIYSTNIMVLN